MVTRPKLNSSSKWLMAAVATFMLSAFATPSPEDRTKWLDARYGAACSVGAADKASPQYQECVSSAYKIERQRAIAQYNTDTGKTGIGVLLIFH